MTDGSFQYLPQGHDLLVHGIVCRRLTAFGHRLFKSVDTVLLYLAGTDFRQDQAAKERHQVPGCSGVLTPEIGFAALTLRDDVVFAQILLRGLAKTFPRFQLSGAELSAKLEIPVLCNLFGSG